MQRSKAFLYTFFILLINSAFILANTYPVTNNSDDGAGSLRAAVDSCNFNPGFDTIQFDPSINGDTILLTGTQLVLEDSLSIQGNGMDSTIIDGSASDRIFEINTAKNVQIKNLTLQNGTSSNGGALFVKDCSPILEGILFKGNQVLALGNGGAVRILADTVATKPVLRNCIFRGNSGNFGGAVSNESDDSICAPHYISCLFQGNVSPSLGGAIHNNGDSGNCQPEFSNCLITGNSALDGSAIWNHSFTGTGICKLINCTVASNGTSTNGDIMTSYGHISLSNTIIWGNSKGNVLNNSTASISYSLIQGDDGASGTGNLDGTDSTNAPLFLELTDFANTPHLDGRYRVRSCSPVLNAGTNDSLPAGVLTDLGNGPRIQQITVDMGAYESPFSGASNQIIFVDSSNTSGVEDGGSWSTAFTDLQDALATACPFDTIWVAKGSYFPTDGTNRNLTFNLPDSLVILGGFGGNETSAGQRDYQLNETILSGNIGNKGSITDNSFNVVTTTNALSLLVDGVSICFGQADGGAGKNKGGGWNDFAVGAGKVSQPKLRNIRFKYNNAHQGAGLNVENDDDGTCKPQISDCTFLGNNSSGSGGGIRFEQSDGISDTLILENCVFQENTANFGGGGVNVYSYRQYTYAVFRNCSFKGNSVNNDGGALHANSEWGDLDLYILNGAFSGNQATHDGGGLYVYADVHPNTTNVNVLNTSFSGNWADDQGGALYVRRDESTNAYLDFTNCILWGNLATEDSTFFIEDSVELNFNYSLVEYANPSGPGNLDGTNPANDPLFLDQPDPNAAPTTEGRLRLNRWSPVINKGQNDSIPAELMEDLAGDSRIQHDTVDLGAYESPFSQTGPARLYVDSSNIDGPHNGGSWSTAFNDLQDALATVCAGDTIWIAKGTYFPTSGTDREIYFELPDSLVLFGGFDGSEDYLHQRNNEKNITILSGDIGNKNDSTDNTLHVVRTINTSSIEVDGLTICHGNASNGSIDRFGGGWLETGSETQTHSTIIIRNVIFEFNDAVRDGAAISFSPTDSVTVELIFEHCVFQYNNSNFLGGAVDIDMEDSESNIVFKDCEFIGNRAARDGGAIYYESDDGAMGEILFEDCLFEDNFSERNGGAVEFYTYQQLVVPTFINSIFIGNEAESDGGAINLDPEEGDIDLTIINGLFQGNKSGSDGGAIELFSYEFVSTINTRILNSTFSGNSADGNGGAISTNRWEGTNLNLEIINSILWGNIAGQDSTLFIDDSVEVSVMYSLLQYLSPSGPGNLDGTNPANDPLFLDQPDPNAAPTTEGKLRLNRWSPVINRGQNDSIPAGLMGDLAGDSRIQHDTVDLGAYESPFSQLGSARIYVDSSNIDGPHNGVSWATAFNDLQDALATVCAGDTIWVAKGTYYPTPTTNRDISFKIADSVVLLGGFSGSETQSDQKNYTLHKTILSGDIDKDGISNGGNTKHIIYTEAVSSNTVVDGFTITLGRTGNSGLKRAGAGWYNNGGEGVGSSNPTIRNCFFRKNRANTYGGALYNYGALGEASPVIDNCSFAENIAGSGGAIFNDGEEGISSPIINKCKFISNSAGTAGAVYNYGYDGGASNPEFRNCSFKGNEASSRGGSIYNEGDNTGGQAISLFVNCIFSGNKASDRGGVIYSYSSGDGISQPTFMNCTMSGNLAGNSGGAVYNSTSSNVTTAIITNSILWGNVAPVDSNISENGGSMSSISYSLVQDQLPPGSGNLDGIDHSNRPQFVLAPDPSDAPDTLGDLRLRYSSPLINRGSNDSIPSGITQDLDGASRIQVDTVDLGAYESPFPRGQHRLYVDSSNISGIENGVSWQTAFTNLQHAMDLVAPKDSIWIAHGTYYPSASPGDSLSSRYYSFHLDTSAVVLGGFAGDTSNPGQRDWELYPTILSGDIGTVDDSTDNTYHVVYLENPDSCVVLDGLIIEKGTADGPQFSELGGGIFILVDTNKVSAGRFSNLIIRKNTAWAGAGLMNFCSSCLSANSNFEGVTFSKNTANGFGGGMGNIAYGGNANPILEGSSFKGNSSNFGGGVLNFTINGIANPTYLNTEWVGNFSVSDGSAFDNRSDGSGLSKPKFVNCSFAGNKADGEGTLMNQEFGGTAYLQISNSVIWGNKDGLINIGATPSNISHSLIQDSIPAGPGNLDGTDSLNDPLFILQPDWQQAPTCIGNLRPGPCSPIVNKGSNDSIPIGILFDLEGNARIRFGTVDLGAYESSENDEPTCNNITITLDQGTYQLSTSDSLNLVSGTPACWTTNFSKTNFNCLDLDDGFEVIDLFFYGPEGELDTCQATITILEDPDYCCSSGNNSNSAYINSVRLESNQDTLIHPTGNNGGFGSFLDSIFIVQPGTTFNLFLNGYTTNSLTQKYWKVWVDWDEDGGYQSDELVLTAQGSSSNQSTSVAIPQGIQGSRTMRISMATTSFSSSCKEHTFGEVEDYRIQLLGCPDTLLLENMVLEGEYRAQMLIQTQGEVTLSGKTTFYARSFELKAGFAVPSGIEFETVSNPCGLVEDD